METTDEVIGFIKSNAPLIELIENSSFVVAPYNPHRKMRSQAYLAMRHFWESWDGREFRFRFEKCAGGEQAARLLRGGGAKVKAAVFALVIERRLREGIDL